ncbi:MAG TPA: glycosyltransferase family A protein, partial [Phycisphaerae bacterium]|nr:glycosyltransferase family A protein [Phycisphaerae bacterium]
MKSIRYFIISPVRNEQQYLPKTIESVVSQSVHPVKWIIVDDGSTDSTGGIIDEAANQHNWIQALHRTDRGFRSAGGGVMEAFYHGFGLVNSGPWDFLVKLDGDVTFEPDYFEQCFARFASNPRLGIAGGLICNPMNGTLYPESKADPSFHVRGATKIYKYECWQAIGGLVKEKGWDTLDEVKANLLGWTTRTFSEIKIVHHRLAGRAYGTWANWVKNGRASYFAGYHPLFMAMKCISRTFRRPFGIAGL